MSRIALSGRAFWLAALLAFSPATPALTPAHGFAASKLSITTSGGQTERFVITLAITPEQQERGLMFIRHLPEGDGMLFPQREPAVMTMWMKNTFIPLDLLFIDGTGHIVCLHERAVPESEALIACPVPVKAVLEIGGGQAAKRGIKVGDLVHHRVFVH